MIVTNPLNEGQQYLNKIPRIYEYQDSNSYDCNVFLLPENVKFNFNADNLIETDGLDIVLDRKVRDLVQIIKVNNPLEIQYTSTNVLTPLTYAESLEDILWHLNTQSVLFTKVSAKTIEWIRQQNDNSSYGKHYFDRFWLPCCGNIDCIKEGEVLCVFNRRVSGWDGSHERPVVELLGAGGHLPMFWDEKEKQLRPLSFKENLTKEIQEELGIVVSHNDITIFGGYNNYVTHELVVLGGIMLDESILPIIQEYALTNIDEDVEGIYMGRFEEVIEYYRDDPAPFAGGKKSAATNFPNNDDLMVRIWEYLEH